MHTTHKSILQRIADKDRSAVNECMEKYGNLVWTLSKKFSRSEAEAELAAERIFEDIWSCTHGLDHSKNTELKCVLYVIFRSLFENSDKLKKNDPAPNKSETDRVLQTFLELKKNLVFLNFKL